MPASPDTGTRMVREDFHVLPDGMRVRYAIIDPPGGHPSSTVFTVPGLGETIAKKDYELGAMLAAQNARHIVFEPRGQGRSSRFLSGACMQRAYIPSFAIYQRDLSEVFAAIAQPNRKGKLLLHGHSTGGLVALSWLAQAQNKPDGAIVSSPPLTLRIPPHQLSKSLRIPVPSSVAFLISAAFSMLGKGADYAWGEKDFAPRFETKRWTHDRARFDWIVDYFQKNSEEIVGGVTWNWLYRTLRRGYAMRLKNELASIAIPVLALLGSEDCIVPAVKTAQWLDDLPRAEIIMIDGAYHEVTNESATYRDQALLAFSKFLRQIT